jgi:hypothetical protein
LRVAAVVAVAFLLQSTPLPAVGYTHQTIQLLLHSIDSLLATTD